MKTMLLLIPLLALMGCSMDSDFSWSAYQRGVADAKKEIAEGRLAMESYG